MSKKSSSKTNAMNSHIEFSHLKEHLGKFSENLNQGNFGVIEFVFNNTPGLTMERLVKLLTEDNWFSTYAIEEMLPAAIKQAKSNGFKPEVRTTPTTTYEVAFGLCFNETGRSISVVLEETRKKLEKLGLLPDEYFGIAPILSLSTFPVNYHWLACYAVTGGNEGHYIHVDIIGNDGERTAIFVGKTLKEGSAGMQFSYQVAGALAEMLGA